jgi:branched-subunit amino acid transport protein AzlD
MLMSDTWHLIFMVAIMAVVSYLLRLFPFVIFAKSDKVPARVEYLGRVISPAAIAMLVVYCFKDIEFCADAWYGLPSIAASILVIILHSIWKNPLLSICAGTICYMLIIQHI